MRRSESGVTLVELLISIVIISFALVPIINFYNFYLRQTSRTNQETKIKFLAQEQIERFSALDYRDSSLDCYGNSGGKTNFFEQDEYLIKTNVLFLDAETGERPELYPVSEEEDTLLKKITVSVARKDQSSKQIDYILFKSP